MRTALVMFLIWSFAATSHAETVRLSAPKVDVAAGYAPFADLGTSTRVPSGWFASVDLARSDRLSTTIEITSSQRTRELPYLGLKSTWGSGTMMFGATFSSGRRRVTPFVRLLGGFVSAGDKDWGYGVGLGIQPGAGVTVALGAHTGARVGVDYRYLHGAGSSGGSARQLAVRAGLSVSLGSLHKPSSSVSSSGAQRQ
jgi:hypothetical protein